MDVGTFKSISGILVAEGKKVVATGLQIIGSGHKGIAQKGFVRGDRALPRALQFLLYMSFVSILLEVPAAALIGVHYENKYYELISVLEQFVTYLACGACFHLTMKWFGGKASLRSSFVITCFTTAYSPLLGVFLTPVRKYTFPAMKVTDNVVDAAAAIAGALHSSWGWFLVWTSWVATTIVMVLFFMAVFRSFRAAHRLQLSKAAAAFSIGLVIFVFFIAVVLEPFDELLLKAFSRA